MNGREAPGFTSLSCLLLSCARGGFSASSDLTGGGGTGKTGGSYIPKGGGVWSRTWENVRTGRFGPGRRAQHSTRGPPESFGGAVGPSFHPAGRGAGRGHLELRPPSSGGAWREGAGDALSHARPVLSGLKMAAAAGVRSRRRGREKESL